MPLALAVGCLVQTLLISPATGWGRAARRVQVMTLLTLGYALLFGMNSYFFGIFVQQSGGRESFWTLRTEATNPYTGIATIIRRDARTQFPASADRTEAPVVVAENWWLSKPLQFFLSRNPRTRVGQLDQVPDPEAQRQILIARLHDGAYAVGPEGGTVDNVVKAVFPPEQLRQWNVKEGAHPPQVIYRLKPAASVLAERPEATRRR